MLTRETFDVETWPIFSQRNQTLSELAVQLNRELNHSENLLDFMWGNGLLQAKTDWFDIFAIRDRLILFLT